MVLSVGLGAAGVDKRKKRKLLICILILGVLAVTLFRGLDTALAVRFYTVETGKLEGGVRLVLITDLHSCGYGEGQRELLDAVEAQAPDAVLLGGDIVDDDKRQPIENALTAVRSLAERYPTYYVTGNHEFWTREVEAIRARLTACGATLLAGDCAELEVRGQKIQICGIDDPDVGESEWREQLERVTASADPEAFTVLLTHRPERVEDYEGRGFDLVLAGHAHGGQWRLPGIINGLLAPNQGLFPKYAGGRYELGETTLVVSRGLARETTRVPRIFNPPEVVIVDVSPGQDEGGAVGGG